MIVVAKEIDGKKNIRRLTGQFFYLPSCRLSFFRKIEAAKPPLIPSIFTLSARLKMGKNISEVRYCLTYAEQGGFLFADRF